MGHKAATKAGTHPATYWQKAVSMRYYWYVLSKLEMKPYCAQGYLFLGELYSDGGQKEKAVDKLKKAEGMYQEMGMDYWLVKTQEVLDRL